MSWRKPNIEDNGKELFVKSSILIDEDFNKNGVVVATISEDSGLYTAICAIWNNDQDCYVTRELNSNFEVCEIVIDEENEMSGQSADLFGFGRALEEMEKGKRVARLGWNGKAMWIALTLGSEFAPKYAREGHASKHLANEFPDKNIKLTPHIDMRTADGSMFVGWTPNQLDVLAKDWCCLD